jgi:hypothetical protein
MYKKGTKFLCIQDYYEWDGHGVQKGDVVEYIGIWDIDAIARYYQFKHVHRECYIDVFQDDVKEHFTPVKRLGKLAKVLY